MTKGRIGFWLLISLIPAGFWAFISIIVGIATEISSPSGTAGGDDPSAVWAASFVLSFLYFIAALIAGIVLKVLSVRERRQVEREVQQYAELHGWQQVSKTSWRGVKSHGAMLAVNQAFEKSTHILTITVEGETLTIPDFESSVLALQFGDWIWDKRDAFGIKLSADVIREQRTEWEQTRSIAIIPPRPGIDPRSRRF